MFNMLCGSMLNMLCGLINLVLSEQCSLLNNGEKITSLIAYAGTPLAWICL